LLLLIGRVFYSKNITTLLHYIITLNSLILIMRREGASNYTITIQIFSSKIS